MDILTLAWRNIGRNRRRTVVTVGAMAFGLFTMVVWFAIFQGMLLDMERTVVDVEIGDLQIHAPTYLDEPSLYTVIDDVDTLISTLEAAGFRASPQLVGGGLAAAGVSAAGATLRGVNVRHDARVSAIPTRLAEGTWLDEDDPAGVVVGRRLARSLDVAIGDEVIVLSQATDGSMANDLYAVRGIPAERERRRGPFRRLSHRGGVPRALRHAVRHAPDRRAHAGRPRAAGGRRNGGRVWRPTSMRGRGGRCCRPWQPISTPPGRRWGSSRPSCIS